MRKRVVYGEANYEALVRKQGYFVDKTRYIETLEMVENPVFLRPRRFGKSLPGGGCQTDYRLCGRTAAGIPGSPDFAICHLLFRQSGFPRVCNAERNICMTSI